MDLVILVGDLARFHLTELEATEEQKLMDQVRQAQMAAMFTGNVKYIHEVKYKRDIQLKDGSKLLGAWCKNITQTDTGYVADFCFDKVLNKEAVE